MQVKMQVTDVFLSKNIHNRFRLTDPAVYRQIFGPGSWAELEDLPPAADRAKHPIVLYAKFPRLTFNGPHTGSLSSAAANSIRSASVCPL